MGNNLPTIFVGMDVHQKTISIAIADAGLMGARGKATQVVVVAIARELVAFMWDIARRTPAVAYENIKHVVRTIRTNLNYISIMFGLLFLKLI